MRPLVFLLMALPLAACDKITGAADQKIADAEAIGFACRVSQKQPEACMKENEAQSPSSILEGWKSADEDIKSGKLDPNMTGAAPSNMASPKKDEAAAADGDKPAEGSDKKDEKTGTDKPDAKKDAHSEAMKNGKDGKDGKEKDKPHD